jgi:hypothetical protein
MALAEAILASNQKLLGFVNVKERALSVPLFSF